MDNIIPKRELSNGSARSPESGSQVTLVDDPNNVIKLSSRRWAVLFAMGFFAATLALGDETTCILHTMLEILDLSLEQYVYAGQSIYYVLVLAALPAAWFIDNYGVRTTMYLAAALLTIRSGFQALLFYPDLPHWHEFKLFYWFGSGITSALLASIFFCTPLKISENWFSPSERSLAWVLMMTISNLGVVVPSFLYPRLINSVADVKPLAYMNVAIAISNIVVIAVCITRSQPKHPPSERMIKSNSYTTPTLVSIKRIFKEKDILIHLIHGSIFEGIYYATRNITQDLFISVDHTKILVGNILSIQAVIGTTVIIVLAKFVHRVKDLTFMSKFASMNVHITYIMFLGTALLPMSDYFVYLAAILHSLSRSWSAPIWNDMNAQLVSGIISQATYSGIAVLVGTIMVTVLRIPFLSLMQKTGTRNDYTYSIAFLAIITGLNTVIYILLFKGKTSKEEETAQQDTETIITDQYPSIQTTS